MKRWNGIQVSSLLTERALGIILFLVKGCARSTCAVEPTWNTVPEKVWESNGARSMRAV